MRLPKKPEKTIPFIVPLTPGLILALEEQARKLGGIASPGDVARRLIELGLVHYEAKPFQMPDSPEIFW